MPNWCATSYCFFGSAVETFNEELERIYNNPPSIRQDFGNTWLGNIVNHYGFDYKSIGCRGLVVDQHMDEKGQLWISTDTAWSPMNEMWDLIIENHYKDRLRYVYIAEEPGLELYINSDPTGMIIPEKYKFEDECDGEYYDYGDEDMLINDVNGYLSRGGLDTIKNIDEIEKALDKYNEKFGTYLSFKEFVTV